MADLTSDQLRVLRELDFYGGVMIVRSGREFQDYEVLEKAGLVLAEATSARGSDACEDGWGRLVGFR